MKQRADISWSASSWADHRGHLCTGQFFKAVLLYPCLCEAIETLSDWPDGWGIRIILPSFVVLTLPSTLSANTLISLPFPSEISTSITSTVGSGNASSWLSIPFFNIVKAITFYFGWGMENLCRTKKCCTLNKLGQGGELHILLSNAAVRSYSSTETKETTLCSVQQVI